MSSINPKIIIIDDDTEKRTIFGEKFRLEGFEVIAAPDGQAGLDLIKKGPPDIIFTGIRMPNMDGFTMVEHLKKDPALKSIPIMINSHLGSKEDQRRSGELGCDEFIYYGLVPLNEIVAKARDLIKKHKQEIKNNKAPS